MSNLTNIPGYSLECEGLEYMEELKQVQTDGRLIDFVERWQALYELDGEKPVLRESTLHCIQTNRKGICDHLTMGENCESMNILLPRAELKTYLLAREYGVSFGVAMHQRYCTGPHDTCF